MLKLNEPINNKTTPMDPRIRAMAAGVILLGEILEKLMPKRRDNPLNYYPRLYNTQAYNSLDWKTLLFDFTYIRNERLYSFTLPAFIKLEERSPNIAVKENQEFTKGGNNENYTNKFIKALCHPLFMLTSGFVSVANIFSMAFTIAKVKITSIAIVKASGLLFNLAGLAVSLCYFIPAIWYYYNNERLRDELLDIFDDAMVEIRKDNTLEAWNKLDNLKFQHSILLHPNYPDNNDLRWSYYYMVDLINEKCHDFRDCDSYKMALPLSETADQKFLVLQGLLNVYDWRLDNQIKKFKELKGIFITEEARESLRSGRISIAEIIAPYVAQIDPSSPMHQQLQADLHYQLQQCVSSFRYGEYALAKEILDNIKWNGYCKKAYPGAAILYYQLQSVLTLSMEPYEPFDMESLCPIGRLKIARENLETIQEYIDKYYPEMSREHQEYIDLFDASSAARQTAYDTPNPYKRPIIYSELIPVSQKMSEEAADDIAADIRNLYPSRTPSPMNYL